MYAQLKQRAAALGFDSAQALVRYMSKAVIDGRAVNFEQERIHDGWGPVPAHVMERWERESKQLQADKKAGRAKSYTDVDKMMKDLLSDEAN